MELDFDKEIDAILRKARGDTGAAVTTGNGSHLDADVIAAFAENALPQTTKLLYTQHLADCDRCRKQLSQAIAMNTEADAEAAVPVSAVLAAAVIPWYQKLFAVRNLAFGMGALVLVFSGVLGYMVLQRSQDGGNATVSQITQQEPAKSVQYPGSVSLEANANSNIAAAPMANMAANMVGRSADSTIAVNPPGTGMGFGSGEGALPEARKEAESAKPVTSSETAGAGAEPPAPAAAPPPPPAGITLDGVAAKDDRIKDADERERKAENNFELSKKSKALEDRSASRRDMPPPAAKTGPSRSGPVQTQSNQVNSGNFDMTVSRRVGGKTFNNRDRVWYDSAYHGQATLNYKRGTDEYNKLDGGLRSIANTLGGTVVLVWKSKAYRIQ